MKILFLHFPLHPAPGGGGAEEHTLLLAKGFQKAGHSTRLASSNKPLLQRFQKEGFHAYALWTGWEPTSIPALLLFPVTAIVASISFLTLFLKQSTIDTVFCLSLTDKLLATPLALLFGKKVIWIEHTRIGRWLFYNPLKYWYLLLSRKVTIVAPSYFSRNQLLQLGVRINNIKVIYHGIHVFTLPPPRRTGEGLGERSKNLITLGYLGRLTEEKGVEVLIQALIKLPSNYNLIIAGSGPAEAMLKNLSNDLRVADRITFIGAIDNKAHFFQSIDALVIPSIQAESFGLVALEAMSAGVPVIASRLGALPEIIEDQKTGLLFEPGSSEQLAEKILWARQNPAALQNILQQARAGIATLFSEERMIKEYMELIKL